MPDTNILHLKANWKYSYHLSYWNVWFIGYDSWHGEVKMIGVVLWSDDVKHTAVIWCEDHGDLAFFSAAPDAVASLSSGDCVEFTVEIVGDIRRAEDLILLKEKAHPALAGFLADRVPLLVDEPRGVDQAMPHVDVPAISMAVVQEKMGELVMFPGYQKPEDKNLARKKNACRVVHVS